jgi:DNA topoisomerase-1
LLEAPDVDPEGNPTMVKFSRKNQAQYGSETPEAKQTKWSLVFKMENGLKLKH